MKLENKEWSATRCVRLSVSKHGETSQREERTKTTEKKKNAKRARKAFFGNSCFRSMLGQWTLHAIMYWMSTYEANSCFSHETENEKKRATERKIGAQTETFLFSFIIHIAERLLVVVLWRATTNIAQNYELFEKFTRARAHVYDAIDVDTHKTGANCEVKKWFLVSIISRWWRRQPGKNKNIECLNRE